MRYRYWELSEVQREQARAMFLGAGSGDGYWYELGQDGNVLCRSRRLVDESENKRRELEALATAARGVA